MARRGRELAEGAWGYLASGEAGRGRGGRGSGHKCVSGRAGQEGVAGEDTGAGRRAAAEGR